VQLKAQLGTALRSNLCSRRRSPRWAGGYRGRARSAHLTTVKAGTLSLCDRWSTSCPTDVPVASRAREGHAVMEQCRCTTRRAGYPPPLGNFAGRIPANPQVTGVVEKRPAQELVDGRLSYVQSWFVLRDGHERLEISEVVPFRG